MDKTAQPRGQPLLSTYGLPRSTSSISITFSECEHRPNRFPGGFHFVTPDYPLPSKGSKKRPFPNLSRLKQAPLEKRAHFQRDSGHVTRDKMSVLISRRLLVANTAAILFEHLSPMCVSFFREQRTSTRR